MKYQNFLPRFITKRINKYQKEKAIQKARNDYNNKIAEFLKSSYVGVQEQNNSLELIVSLTSYPARIPYIKYTLYTLLMQSCKPNQILLWLSKEEFPKQEQDLPQEILEFVKHGLTIKWCEKNIRSYKKLIPTLQEFPNSIIVTADDDVLYPQEWLSKLYESYQSNPEYIHCHRAHRILFDEKGEILPYNQWKFEIPSNEAMPSVLNFATGVGGILYPPNCFYQDVLKEDIFMNLAPTGDDIWFWAMAVLNGRKINVVGENFKLGQNYLIDEKEVGSLWQHNKNGANDESVRRVFEKYPQLKEKVKFNSNEYWEIRYRIGGKAGSIGPSGAGSYNNLAVFKSEVLNEFVAENNILEVLEFGCGDGNQLSYAKYPYYVGVDVSMTIVNRCREIFAGDTTKQFYELQEFLKKPIKQFELCLSLDVIYHLIEDRVFEEYMKNLFEYSNKYVAIYASNKNELWSSHVKHRKFSDWIENYYGESVRLVKIIPNKYPYDPKNPDYTSFADFYIYEKGK